MKYFLAISILLSVVSTLFGQEEKREVETRFKKLAEKIRMSTYFDSLSVFSNGQNAIRIADSLGDLSKKGLVYQYYGNFNYYSGRHERALTYYDTTLNLAREAGDSTLINSTLIRQNFIADQKRNNDNTELRFKQLLKASKRRNDYKNALEALNGLAILSERKNDQGKALEFYYEALSYAEKLDDLYLKGMLLNNIGLIKFRNEQFDDALTDFKKGLKYSDSIDNFRLAFHLQNNIGLLYEQTGEVLKSIKHFEQTLKNANRLGFPFNIAVTHLNLSNSYILNNQYELSILHADSMIQILNRIKDYRYISKPYFIKAMVYRQRDVLDSALILVDSALTLAKQYENNEDIIEGYSLKSEILKDAGQYEEALLLFEQYSQMRDSIDEISSQERFEELQVAYETEKKEAELKEERARTAMLEKDNKIQESRILVILIIGLFIIIAAALFFYLRHLRITRSQQQKFSQELIANLDEERSRISRDLHDDIGQSLSIAKSKVNMFNKGQISDLVDLEEGLGEVIEQARSLSHRLHPSYLEKIGLTRSVKSLLDRVEKSSGMIASCDLDKSIDDLPLPIQNQLFRILQECINNTLKHASAKSVKVSIFKRNGSYSFQYQDNGKGFDAERELYGLGMMTIKERAQKIDGRVTIDSQLGKGFKLVIKFNSI